MDEETNLSNMFRLLSNNQMALQNISKDISILTRAVEKLTAISEEQNFTEDS